MIRSEKEVVVKEIVDILTNAKSVFLTDFKGLNVEKMGELRRKCRESSVQYQVIKNTLGRRAAKEAGWDDLIEHLEGPSALAYSYDDPVAPARIISEFAEEAEKPTIKVSLFEGQFYGPDKVDVIKKLPSRDVLLGKLVSGLNSPIQGFVGGLHGLLQKLVMTLDAVKTSKE